MKLKNKLYFKPLLLLLAMLLLGGIFLYGGSASAESYRVDQIEVNTSIQQNGKEVSHLRVGRNGSVSFDVVVKLVKPSKFTTDEDELNFPSDIDKSSSGFGATVTWAKVGSNGNVAGDCSTISWWGGSTFVRCKGQLQQRKLEGIFIINNKTYNAGDIVFQDTFTIRPGDFNELGINNEKSANNPGFNEILIYPEIHFVEFARTDAGYISFTKAGKSIVVQLYPSQAEAQADTSQPPMCANLSKIDHDSNGKPTCVPGAGSNTGSGDNINNKGSVILGFINELISGLVFLLQQFLYLVFTYLISPLLVSMLSIRTYTDAFAAVIYPGWEVIRNLCNILFIISLIAIALGTLFRLESYQYKHMLVQLIIAALLVNFSLVMAQAVLGLADTIQNQFLPNNSEVVNALAYKLFVTTKVAFNGVAFEENGYFALTLKPLFLLGFTIASFVIFSAVTVFLVIRVVGLWVLLMVSPIAYAAGALPTTAHYRSEWWGQFIKYAFFTPIMAFFLNIAAVMAGAQLSNPALKELTQGAGVYAQNDGAANFILSVASNVIILAFLIAGIKIAEQFGIMGTDIMAKVAKGGMMAPFGAVGWLGKRGFGRLRRAYNEYTAHLVEQHGDHPVPWIQKAKFAFLNPVNFAKGWQERAHELEHHAQEEAASAGRMVAEQYLTSGAKGIATLGFAGKPQVVIPYNQFTARKHENDYLKDYENMRKESLMAAAVAVESMGGAEGAMRKRAIIKAAAKQGYMDDILRMRHFANKYADKDGTVYSAEILNRFLFDYLGDNEQAKRFMAEDMEQLGKDTGHYEYLGHAYFDNNTKTWKRGMEETDQVETVNRDGKEYQIRKLKNTWQVGYAVGELKKISGRLRAQIAPHNMVALRGEVDTATGQFLEKGDELTDMKMGRPDGRLDEYSRAVMAQFDAATLQQSSFAQSRLKEWLLSFEIDKRNGEVIIHDEADFKRLQEVFKENPNLVRAMYAQMVGLDAVRAREITGIKAAYYNPGRPAVGGAPRVAPSRQEATLQFGAPPRSLGDYKDFDIPLMTEIATDVAKNKATDLGLSDNDLKVFVSKLSAQMDPMIRGQRTRADIETAVRSSLSPAYTANPANAPKITAAVNDLTTKLADQIQEKYSGYTVIETVNKRMFGKNADKVGLNPAQISDLNKELEQAAKEAFEVALAANRPMNDADIRGRVTTRLNDLVTRTSDAKFATVNTADNIETFVKHINPTI